MNRIARILQVLSVLLAGLLPAARLAAETDWPQFRGDGSNASHDTGLPANIDLEHNVAWTATLPGRGASSPIVVAGRVLVTASSGVRQDRLHVLCFDAATGKLLWDRQLWATGITLTNPFGAGATCTPASDGKRFFVFYSSNDLVCFDLDGNLQWYRGLGYECPTTRNDVGMASSPLAVGDTLVVQLENQGESFAAGLDTASGETRWRLERPREATWTSPYLLRGSRGQADVVLLQSKSFLSAHEPRTGKEIWRYETPCHTIASGTTAGDTVFLPAEPTCALRYEPKKGVQAVWQERRLRCDSPSLVTTDGRLYLIKGGGVLACADAADGKTLWQLRLQGPFWATPLVAGNHLYAVNHDGLLQMVDLTGEGKLTGTAQLDRGMLASPAAAGGALYFRSDQHLWKFVAQPK
jgi:outer membrane protein assembly factor BamB